MQNGTNGKAPAVRLNGDASRGAAPSIGAAPATDGGRARPQWCEVVKVAARASVDPVTVLRYLDGKPSRSTTRKRIELGLVKCGLGVFVRRASSE